MGDVSRLIGGILQENQAETPETEVSTGIEELPDGKWLWSPITSVSLNAADHPFGFRLREEFEGAGSLVGEVNKESKTEETDDDGEDAFHDEDPSPSCLAANAVHLHQAIRENLQCVRLGNDERRSPG